CMIEEIITVQEYDLFEKLETLSVRNSGNIYKASLRSYNMVMVLKDIKFNEQYTLNELVYEVSHFYYPTL
ncbi:3745_t:CDS:1, partial [Dentiscutata erythropus]